MGPPLVEVPSMFKSERWVQKPAVFNAEESNG